MTPTDRARNYIDTVLQAHDRAGLVIERHHFFTIRELLCGVENATPVVSPVSDGILDTEPAPAAARRLLRTSGTR